MARARIKQVKTLFIILCFKEAFYRSVGLVYSKEPVFYRQRAYQLTYFTNTNFTPVYLIEKLAEPLMEPIRIKIRTTFLKGESSKQKRERSKSLYQKLYMVLKQLIGNNEIPAGSALPATRTLAEELNLSRSTVIRSFELLCMEGYIEARAGSGYRVKEQSAPKRSSKLVHDDGEYPGLSALGKSFLANTGRINSTSDKSIAFRPGVPPLDLFPVSHWKNLSNLYWRHIKTSELIYSPDRKSTRLNSSHVK